ncbi:MAG: hypothetical protein IJR33_08525 [Clostridia bacterium]|nr:hypothetical protein [Clostridia bacterium]
MRDIVRYINSAGQEQFFNRGKCLCNTKALREFLYTVQNKRLYSNQPKTVVLETVFHGSPGERDAIIDLLEYDSIQNTYGRLYVNEWYLLCRFVGIQSIAKEGLQNIRMNLQFAADTIEWSRESSYTLTPVEYPQTDYQVNDYPTDYPHDYGISSEQMAKIVNNELSPADIRVRMKLTSDIISTEQVSFAISNSDNSSHTYSVNLTGFTVAIGNEFVLDTQAKTVEILTANSSFSVFGGTVDDYYIFEKISAGTSVVESDYSMTVDVIEHRRLPKWKT